MNIPPRKGRGRLRRVSMEEVDEEATSTPQVSQSQNEPQAPPGFEPQPLKNSQSRQCFNQDSSLR